MEASVLISRKGIHIVKRKNRVKPEMVYWN